MSCSFDAEKAEPESNSKCPADHKSQSAAILKEWASSSSTSSSVKNSSKSLDNASATLGLGREGIAGAGKKYSESNTKNSSELF